MTNRFLNRTREWLVMLIGAVLVWATVAWVCRPKIIVTTGVRENPGIARAEAVNMAVASFVLSIGQDDAAQVWRSAGGDQERYELLSPFLAYSPAKFAEYIPDGFSIELSSELLPVSKVRLFFQKEEIAY